MISKRLRILVSVTEFQNDVLKINYFDKLLNDALLGHSEVMITKCLRIRVSVTEFQNDVLKINYFDKLLNDALLGHSEVMTTKRLRIRVSVTEFQNSILCFSAVCGSGVQSAISHCMLIFTRSTRILARLLSHPSPSFYSNLLGEHRLPLQN